ncbi:hypothetical protein EYM_02945 [Ignicoccus islandicus DSM 13165]|uniref:Uncharacterized protein n=1 Tax=Ignicoccus islandicus DSM 13165 TaxID=940295 RepID=A0A0U3FKJ3_9CREN|nr:hypothetical protein [Ignicoccus islandicus]ALU12374.1 hypothetical protein EYM_02945 [Ignicoccus islandicus DSM 13165]
MAKGLGSLETAILISVVTLISAGILTWMINAKPSSEEKGGQLFVSAMAVGFKEVSGNLTEWFNGGGTIKVSLPNVSDKVYLYKPSFDVIGPFGDKEKAKSVILGRVLAGRGCISGVKIYDLNSSTIAIVQISTQNNECVRVRRGQIIMVYVPILLDKFANIKFFGPSHIHTLNVWMTQVR